MDQIEIEVNSTNNEESEKLVKCRTCNASSNHVNFCFLFEQWKDPWNGMQNTIAEDLITLTHINLHQGDGLSCSICADCCNKLREACQFVKLVQDNNGITKWTLDNVESTEWPKPILVEKTIPNLADIEIKQEILSDDDMERDGWVSSSVELTEIKVEPEEMLCAEYLNSVINVNSDKEPLTNGDHHPDELLDIMVKEELSEDEWDSDLPLDCALCSKMFNSLSGLKAHVIAQHSYNLKKSNSLRIVRHVCIVCKRTFETSTDLMVHETCHNKNKCFGCKKQFDTFADLSKHSRRCTVSRKREASPPKVLTLEDVLRTPNIEETTDATEIKPEPFKCNICNSTFTDEYYFKVHEGIHDTG